MHGAIWTSAGTQLHLHPTRIPRSQRNPRPIILTILHQSTSRCHPVSLWLLHGPQASIGSILLPLYTHDSRRGPHHARLPCFPHRFNPERAPLWCVLCSSVCHLMSMLVSLYARDSLSPRGMHVAPYRYARKDRDQTDMASSSGESFHGNANTSCSVQSSSSLPENIRTEEVSMPSVR